LVLPGRPEPLRFPQPIEQVLPFDDILVARLAWSDNTRNVYAVNERGEIVWQIDDLPLNPNGAIIFGIAPVSNTVVAATSSMGVTLHLDVRTGEVLTSIPTK
jgi:outer membrane protein assembly factor BamB